MPIETTSFPPSLSREEEAKLARKMTTRARQTLALHSMNEAVRYASACAANVAKIPRDEIISLCWDALYKSSKAFDPNRGLRFFAYAKVWVRGSIVRAYRSRDTVRNSHKIFDPDYCPPAGEARATEIEQAHAVPSPRREAISRELLDLIGKLIATLRPRERFVVSMRLYEDKTFSEIAEKLKMTRTATQAIFCRAARRMRGKLYREHGITTHHELLSD